MNQSEKKFVDSNNASGRPNAIYGDVINQIKEEAVCPFCPEHLPTYHKKPIIDESSEWLITENMYPYQGASEHLLFIHRSHIEDITEMSSRAWQELKALVEAVRKARDIRGTTLVMRCGETAFTGASVSHLHAQLISGSGQLGSQPVLTRVG